MHVQIASISAAEIILAIQKLAYESQAKIYNDYTISPLVETLEALENEFLSKTIYKAVQDNSIIGAVRAILKDNTCYIGRLCVHPNYQGQGIGTRLLQHIENEFSTATRFELFAGSKSEDNIRLYKRLGYRIFKSEPYSEKADIVYMQKLSELEKMND